MADPEIDAPPTVTRVNAADDPGVREVPWPSSMIEGKHR
jgi:hypothetical protein